MGSIRNVRGKEWEWLVRSQNEAKIVLEWLTPYLKIKKNQAILAKRILNASIKSSKKLIVVATLADTLSALNVRSQGRRKNFMTMIQERISPND